MTPDVAPCPFTYRHGPHEHGNGRHVCPGVVLPGRPIETVQLAVPCSFYGVEGCTCVYCEPQ